MHQFTLKKDQYRHQVIANMMEHMKTLIKDEKYEQCSDLQEIIDTLSKGKHVVLMRNLDWELCDFLANGLNNYITTETE